MFTLLFFFMHNIKGGMWMYTFLLSCNNFFHWK